MTYDPELVEVTFDKRITSHDFATLEKKVANFLEKKGLRLNDSGVGVVYHYSLSRPHFTAVITWPGFVPLEVKA